MTAAPASLDAGGIAERIPHAGRMCLLDRLEACSETEIHCSALSHRDRDNPLRSAGGLRAVCAIEYAAQAMALHGALRAPAAYRPSAGYLASVRGLRLGVARLDDVAGPLQVRARHLAGDAQQVLYVFSVSTVAGTLLAEGRATVLLDTPPARMPA